MALRHEAANLVGFDNYAEYSLATKMANSNEEVLDFLRELATHSRDAAEQELSDLQDLYSDMPICDACFSGNYPTEVSPELFADIERERVCSKNL